MAPSENELDTPVLDTFTFFSMGCVAWKTDLYVSTFSVFPAILSLFHSVRLSPTPPCHVLSHPLFLTTQEKGLHQTKAYNSISTGSTHLAILQVIMAAFTSKERHSESVPSLLYSLERALSRKSLPLKDL